MDVPSRSLFGDYGQLLKEWCISAFVSATFDWVGSKIPVRNGIFATLLSIGQITLAFIGTNMMMGMFSGAGSRLMYASDNWLAYNTIIIMSPTAINRLRNSYLKLHFILYGPGKIPQNPISDCASGNCSSDTMQEKVSPQRELAMEMPKGEQTVTSRISSQWRAMKNSPTSK